jgi:hypothetical protein
VDNLKFADPIPPWKTKTGKPYDSKTTICELLKKGAAGLDGARAECNEFKDMKKEHGFRGIKPALLKTFESVIAVDGQCWSERLAALFCNRTQYGTGTRKLCFGTVVRHKVKNEDPWGFSVCLMPICDSQRLKKPCRFPFWLLKENAKCGLSTKRHGCVVVDSENVAHSLAAGGKIRDMVWLAQFNPDPSGWVVATHSENLFSFKTDDVIVEWVGELKPLHAQRIAAYLGNEASRVGLVESEWLRLFCDR